VLSSFLVNHLHLLFLILHFLSLSSHGFFGYTQLPIHKFSIFFIFIIIACFLGIDLVSKEVSQILLVFQLLLGCLFQLQIVDFTVVIRDLVPVIILPRFDIHSGAACNAPELWALSTEGCFSVPLWGRLRSLMATNKSFGHKIRGQSIVLNNFLAHAPLLACNRKYIISDNWRFPVIDVVVEGSSIRFSRVSVFCYRICNCLRIMRVCQQNMRPLSYRSKRRLFI